MKNGVFFLIVLFLLSFVSASFGYNKVIREQDINIFQGNLTNLSQLQDTNIPTPTDGYLLSWDDATSMWVDIAPGAVGDTNETPRVTALYSFSYYNATDFNIADYYGISNPYGFYNATNPSPDTNETSFVINLTSTNCSGTDKMVGVWTNGTPICDTDSGVGGETDPLWSSNYTAYNTSWSYWEADTNISDTNETVRVNYILGKNCTGTDKFSGFYFNGTPICSVDIGVTDTNISKWTINETHFVNNSGTLEVNRTFFDTIYTLLSNLVSLVGNWSADKSDYWNTSEELSVSVNITTTGNITGDYFFGNGSQLTGIDISDTNETSFINNLTATNCSAGEVYYQIFSNGTLICVEDIDTNISDTNETIRFTALTGKNCTGTDKYSSVYNNGTLICSADSGGSDTNASTACTNNEVLLGDGSCYDLGFIQNSTNVTNHSIYAQLSDLTDQVFASTNTPQPINLSNEDEIYGLVHSTGVNNSQITIVTSGVYTILAQPQVTAGAGDSGTFHMWLEKHNTTRWLNVSNSNVELTLASNDEDVIPLIISISLRESEKIRVMGSVSDTGIELDAQTPSGEPTIPSIIFSMFITGPTEFTDTTIPDTNETTRVDALFSFSYYNATDFNITDYYGIGNAFGFYNSTNPPPGANASWNQSHADTLYYDLGNSFSFFNATNPSPDTNISDSSASINCTGAEVYLGNGTCSAGTYLQGSGADTNASSACSGTEVLLGNGTCISGSYFDTDTNISDTNETVRVDALFSFSYYNSTDFDFNDYYLENNPYSFYNSTTLSITDTNASTACTGVEYLGGDGSCYNWTDTNISDTTIPDTNASTACSETGVLLGNGTCFNSTLFFDDTDTNISDTTIPDTNSSTACSGTEVLLGNGTCVEGSIFDTDTNISDTNISDTNASTACAGMEYFAGNGTCYNVTYTIDTNISDTNCSDAGDCPNIIYTTNVSILNVNSSVYWNTANQTNSTQFTISLGIFSIDLTWLMNLFISTEVDPVWTANFTAYNTSWSYWEADTNISDTNETTRVDALFSFSYYNATDFNIADYYGIGNAFGFYNSTNPQTETDPLWASNFSNVVFINKVNTFGAYNQSFDSNVLFVDANNNRVGIGTTSPTHTLNVVGDVNITGNMTMGGGTIYSNTTCIMLKGDTAILEIC